MNKKDLLEILAYVFDHYIEADLEDEQREDVRQGYNQIKGLIEKSEI